MLKGIKSLIRKSPLGPLVIWLHRRCFPSQQGAFHAQNAKYDQETKEVMRRDSAAGFVLYRCWRTYGKYSSRDDTDLRLSAPTLPLNHSRTSLHTSRGPS